MSNFEQFEYKEILSGRNIDTLPDLLRFDRNIKEEGKLIRLLTGTVKIVDNISDKSFYQKCNYSILGVPKAKKITPKLFTNFLDTTYSFEHIDNYLKKSEPKNITFFKEILLEFTNFFSAKHSKKFTLCFLHLYRLLEHLSFSFPMLYAARAKGYTSTFNKLQNFFKNSDNELKFLQLFIDEFFTDQAKEFPVVFSVTAHNEDVKKNYFKVIKSVCNNGKPQIPIKSETEYSEIILYNKDLTAFFISLRNRYFHFAAGSQKNIQSSLLQQPDDFFEIFIESFANWLAYFYFEIIRQEIEE